MTNTNHQTDPDRGTGRTMKQMREAPYGSTFVWCNDMTSYPQKMAIWLGRFDLRIVGRPSSLDGLRGISWSSVVVDHAAPAWVRDHVARNHDGMIGGKRAEVSWSEPNDPASYQVHVTLGAWSDESVAKLQAERDAAIARASSLEFSAGLLKGAICEGRLERQVQLDQGIDVAEIEAAGWIYDVLKHEWRIAIRVNAMTEQTAHDYHGPKQDGKAVSDDVYERFHRAWRDVMAGLVQAGPRRQMQEALKNAPKEAGPAPMPKGALGLGEPSDFSTETLIFRRRYRAAVDEMDMRGLYGSSPICSHGFGDPDAPPPVVQVSAAPTASPLPVTAIRVEDDRRKVGWRPAGEG